MKYDEKELILACRAHDRSAQKYLYDCYAPKFFTIALRYCQDEYQAEDVLQESFIRIYTCIDQFEFIGSFEGWMRRIVVNTALEEYRKRNKKQTTALDQIDFSLVTQVSETIDHEYLLKIIQSLPPGYRQVFNLYIIEGYAHKEIADMLGISESTSKSQLNRARKAIIAIWQKMQQNWIFLWLGATFITFLSSYPYRL
ncbi:MAG: RNA polymerase sigma factor [Chitinophagales bacterium]|nr:RNA polymerase sigma factor [Chitinophagales bacterium]